MKTKQSFANEIVWPLLEAGKDVNKGRLARELRDELGINYRAAYQKIKRAVLYYESKGLLKECEDKQIPIERVTQYWHKGKHFSLFVKNEIKSYEEIREDLISEMRAYSPEYPEVERNKTEDGHLLVIDPADVHIGKLAESIENGEDYNSQIAVQRVRSGVQGILDKSSGFNIDRILLVIGNDILHIDTPKRTTTSGTTQDTDGMWYGNFLMAKDIYIEVIEKLMQIADVHVTFNPSNHDYMSGFFLADTIHSWFSKSKNITFDVSISHRKYFRYFNNIIGTTHGDGAKTGDLPLLMAQECGHNWLAKHRYIYTHHVHHKTAKDFGSVCVEALRSPSGTDSWHHRNGYQHSPKAIEGFIHHKEHGQVARLTNIF